MKSVAWVANTSRQAINKKLQQAYCGEMIPGLFYLVTGNEYPVLTESDDSMKAGGTIPPITGFISSFSGKTIEEAAAWLQNGPEWLFLDRKNFAVLDDNSEAKDTITICRRNPRKADGTIRSKDEYGEVQFYPCSADEAGNCMIVGATMAAKFDDYLDIYQLQQVHYREPDLSRGKPYYRLPESAEWDYWRGEE